MTRDFRNRDWLYNEYINKKRSMSDIGRDFGKYGSHIGYYLDKFGITKRGLSETLFLIRKNPSIKMTNEIREFVVGNVLGDGSIQSLLKKRSQRTASYAHSNKHREILEYIRDKMLDFGFEQMGKINKYIHRQNGAIYYTYWTKHYEELLRFRHYLYKDNNKVIPRDIILTPEICLHWYLGDGSLVKPTKARPYINIHTEGFSTDDVEFATALLNNTIGIRANRMPSTNSVRISRASDVVKFLRYIKGCPVEIQAIYGYKFL